jgi:vancomycin resistance protein VanJ
MKLRKTSPPGDGKPVARWLLVVRAALKWAAWGYLLSVLFLWAFIYEAGDRWWVATLILFGPRWLCLIPLAPLVPLACIFRRLSLYPLAAAAFVAVVPLAGFCIGWAALLPGSPTIRVLTCNVKGHSDRNERLDDLIRQSNPDIVALQGCWNESRVEWPAGWHVIHRGELIVASRFPLQEVRMPPLGTDISARGNPLCCIVTLPEGELRIATAHLQSPHYGIARVLDRKTGIRPSRSDLIISETDTRWTESEQMSLELAFEYRPDIVVGDLNQTVESPIYRTYWSEWWNAFSVAGWGWGGTEWPQHTAGIRFGVRIDHILSNRHWRPKRAWVGSDIGSDHLPLLADLVEVR